jgi:acyl-CoA synthetase (AMP-forming)/AMP-acid ligase II
MSFNLAVILRESRNAHPDKPLCYIADQTFSYAQVDEISGRIAASLRNLGVRRGDKVAVQLPNLPHFLFAYFGILKAGAVMVPLNPLLRAPEIRYPLADSDSRLLITFETSADEAVKGAAKIEELSVYVVNLPGNAQRPEGTKSFDELYLADNTGDIEPTDADDTAVITYTSGTTGKPKGAKLTHYQLYADCTAIGHRFRFGAEDVSMAVLPMFHVLGLSSVLNVAVRFGGTLVLVPPFDAQTVIDEFARHRCTIFSGVPTMFGTLLQADTEGRDLSALRVGVSGGAAISGDVIRAFEEKFPGVLILDGHGMSDTASKATFTISASPTFHRIRDALTPERIARYCVAAAMFLLLISVMPWRWEKYFSGQLDWVVLAKAGLLIAAVCVVLWAKHNVASRGRSINNVVASALLMVALYLGVSVMGAFLFGSLKSSVQLSVRVLVVGFVVLVSIELVEPMIAISMVSGVLAAVAMWLGASGGMDSDVYPARLIGHYPPTTPNEIAFLAAVPIIYFVWRTVNVDTSFLRLVAVIPLGVIIMLSQSRTTGAIVAAVILSLIIRGTRHGRLRLTMITLAVIYLLFSLTFTDAIQHFGTRGGTSSIESAGSRMIAWHAVLNTDRSPMQTMFGQGIAGKVIPVTGQFWSSQLMDSSWFSAFLQAGLIGFALLIVILIYAGTQAFRNARPAKDLWVALLVFVVIRSVFESGLLDASMSFLVFMVISMGAATQAHPESFSRANHFHARV